MRKSPKKRKLFQFNLGLHAVYGIQKVMLDIHAAVKDKFDAKFVGKIPYDRVNPNLGISKEEYIRFKNPLQLRNSIVVFHERRLLPLMWVLSHIPFLGIKSVYVHHNMLFGHKRLSLFPKKIVAISDSGIKNLTEYFKVPKEHITKIYNCVIEKEAYQPSDKKFNPEHITILYPAAVTEVKRQREIVNHLRGKLDPRVTILFAGTGYEEYDKLKELCKNDNQFKVLGFVKNIHELMKEVDFTMLFSTREGLPISLIESCMLGVPIICNDVGGNTEIVANNENGYVVNSWEELLATLNNLPNKTEEEVRELGKNGREKFNLFRFDKFKNNYLSLLESV